MLSPRRVMECLQSKRQAQRSEPHKNQQSELHDQHKFSNPLNVLVKSIRLGWLRLVLFMNSDRLPWQSLSSEAGATEREENASQWTVSSRSCNV